MAASNSMNMDENGVQTYNTTTGNLVGSATTQYNVLVGDTTNKIANVSPSATSGVPLISQGSSANPAFGTAVVAGGGTGNTTFTAYSVITAGTTATGAFQNVSGVGTSGQVLTSNGASALPTWQNASTSSFSTNLNLYEDFLGNFAVGFSTFPCTYYWNGGNAACVSNFSTSDASHPGIVGNDSHASGSSGLSCGIDVSQMKLGGGAISLTWIIKVATLSTGTNTYTLRVGLGDTLSGDQVNGVYFEYTNSLNSGAWVGKTASASSRTSANSANTVNTNWVNLTITINAAATSVSFFVDGVQINNSPLALTIPTTPLTPICLITRSAGTVAQYSVLMDLCALSQTLTTPR